MNSISKIQKAQWSPEPWQLSAVRDHLVAKVKEWYERRPVLTSVVLGLLLVGVPLVIFAERPVYQQYFLIARRYGLAIALGIVFAIGTWWILARWNGTEVSVRGRVFARWSNPHRAKGIVGAVMLTVLASIMLFGKQVHDYTSQYYRYRTLDIVDLEAETPETGFERILPLKAVHTLALGRMNENQEPTDPDMVRDGNGYRWTLAIEPASPLGRFVSGIEEFLSIPVDEASTDFSRSHPEKVHFNVGETLYFSRNIHTCTRLSFGFWRSFSYEPGNVTRARNDAGKWVQIVSLTKWTGWVWPQPEFGGVQIIEQGETNIFGRILWGCGRWIRPEQVKDHRFLVGQNLVPYTVSRNMAESLRFHAGFLAPVKFSGIGDIRIADLADDVNQQPFTLFFKIRGEAKLYQYLGLEPRDANKQGLATSLFLPADGIGAKYAIKHYDRRTPIGMTAVPAQVRASRKQYDWTHNAVVEIRPYVHSIADTKGRVAPRFAWMATVVAVTERKPGEPLKFTSGSDPEIALVDAYWNKVVWVDSQRPEKWPEQLKEALAEQWAKE